MPLPRSFHNEVCAINPISLTVVGGDANQPGQDDNTNLYLVIIAETMYLRELGCTKKQHRNFLAFIMTEPCNDQCVRLDTIRPTKYSSCVVFVVLSLSSIMPPYSLLVF